MSPQRISGLIVTGFGLVLWLVVLPFGIDSPTEISHPALAPEFWPNIIAVVIMVSGVWLCFSRAEVPVTPPDRLTRWRRVGLAMGLLLAFYYTIPLLGMVLPGMLLMVAFMYFAGERRWPLMLLLAFGVPMGLYAFFTFVASIPIPLGMFEFLRG